MTLAILTSSRTRPTAEYEHALLHHSPQADVLAVTGRPVDEARNRLVRNVLALDPRPEFTAWIDDDAFWMPGTIERLIAHLDTAPKLSMVVPWCGKRPIEGRWLSRDINFVPLAYRLVSRTPRIAERFGDPPSGPMGSVSPLEKVDFVGFHFVVHRTSLLEAVPRAPFTMDTGLSEDLSFCERLEAISGSIFLDSTLPVWHVGRARVDGGDPQFVGFCPRFPAVEIVNGQPTILSSDVVAEDEPRSYFGDLSPAGLQVRERIQPQGRTWIFDDRYVPNGAFRP